MARSTGIRIGSQRFELVALEGSAKKPKIRHLEIGSADPEAELPMESLASGLRALTKRDAKRVDAEEVHLAVDAGVGVYRYLTLPFADRSKIEDVIKFEVESQIPQWDVDDLVCDFIVLDSDPVQSHLLVTAVPKDALSERLDACGDAGLEPLDAELETSALFTAAEYAGLIDDESSSLLMYLGERSTSIVTVVAGRPVAMRALHLSLSEFAPQPSVAELPDSVPTDSEEEPAAQAEPPDAARIELVLDRIAREIVRTLQGSDGDHEFGSIHVCGLDVPGLVGGEIQGLPIHRLDPLEQLAPEMSPEERGMYAPAFGAALRGLGGASIKTNLRREELAFAGTFERLELPLGVLGLLLLTLFGAQYVILDQRLQPRVSDFLMWTRAQRNFMIGQPKEGEFGDLQTPPKELANQVKRITELGGLEGEEPLEQLDIVDFQLSQEIREIQRQLGTSSDVQQPMSALSAMTLVVDVLSEMKASDEIGLFSIRSAAANYIAGRANSEDRVEVKLNLTFFGDSPEQPSAYYNAFLNRIEEKPWVNEVTRSSLETLEQGIGNSTDGLIIEVDTNKARPPEPGETAQAGTSADSELEASEG